MPGQGLLSLVPIVIVSSVSMIAGNLGFLRVDGLFSAMDKRNWKSRNKQMESRPILPWQIGHCGIGSPSQARKTP